MSANKTSNGLWWGAGIACVLVLAYGLGPGHWLRASEVQKLRGQRVQRGQLEISVVQRGNLAARDSVSLVSEIEGTTTVLSLVKEGAFVKKGDLLVELDGSQILEKKVAQEIAVQNADATFKKAKAQFDIQESQNKSDIEAAERKLNFANIDQKKYLEGDLVQLTETANQKILVAEQEYTQATITAEDSKKLFEKGFLTKSESDRDELSKVRSGVSQKQADLAKKILVEYEDPRKKAELEANVKEADRGLERAKLRAEAQIADADANLKSSEAKLRLEREKLDKYVAQLDKIKIRAPTDGMVVYTRMEGGMRGGGDQPMQEGSQVRERQEILQIPREGGMIVEASVHESVLKQVSVNLACTIRVDSQPGKEFYGHVTFVALLPDKGSWWANPNLRLYKTEIMIDRPAPGSEDALKELRPGMSCAISILSELLADAIYVPLQSVFVDKGESIAFVAHGDQHERRALKVGRSNDKFVQVLEGVKEGEEVLLSAPPGFSPSGVEENKKENGNRPPMPPLPDGAPGAAPAGAGGADPAANGAMPPAADGAQPGADGRRTGNRPRNGAGGGPNGPRRNRDGAAAPGGGSAGAGTPGGGGAEEKPAPAEAPKSGAQGDGKQR